MEPADPLPHPPQSTGCSPTTNNRVPNTPPTPTIITASPSSSPPCREVRNYPQQSNSIHSIQRPPSAFVRDQQSQRQPEWPHDHRYHAFASPSQCSPNPAGSPSTIDQGRLSPSLPKLPVGQDAKDSYNAIVRAGSRNDSVAGYLEPSLGHEKQHPSVTHAPHRSVDHPRPSYTHIVEDIDHGPGDEMDEKLEKRQTLRALMHLALSGPFLSILIMLYAVLIAVSTVLMSPLRLCKRSSLRTRIMRYLLPPLNLQRRFIFARSVETSPPHPALPQSQTEASTVTNVHHISSLKGAGDSCSATKLLITHLLSPVVSLALCVFAWITAFAWLPSAMLSHERTGGVSDDERRMAERLVGAWFSWLDLCVKQETEISPLRPRKQRRERRTTKEVGSDVV